MKKYIIYTLLAVMLVGCVSESKKRFRAEEFYREHAEEFANKCADKFPVQKEYIKGETVTEESVIYVPADSVDCPPETALKPSKVKCPDVKIITKNTVRVDTLKLPNPARERALELASLRLEKDVSGLKAQLNAVENQSRNRLKLLLLFILIGLFSVYKLIKS